MTERKNCQRPGACEAGARGPCRICSDTTKTAARMKALHADPEFKAATAARMKALHADPEFKAANSERSSARMKALHADPEFKAATAARMKALNADPEFKAANSERSSARMKALNADRLSWCPPGLIEDYRLLVRHLGAAEARALIERRMRKAA